jgi:LacI family transcriptional regulator
MIRMKDVAERCGVSETTVSHVVNHTRHVSPETRRKVLKTIRDLGFYTNAHARRLARGSSDFLGLLISRRAKIGEARGLMIEALR